MNFIKENLRRASKESITFTIIKLRENKTGGGNSSVVRVLDS